MLLRKRAFPLKLLTVISVLATGSMGCDLLVDGTPAGFDAAESAEEGDPDFSEDDSSVGQQELGSTSWTFDNSSGINFDDNLVEITSGLIRLKQIDQTDDDNDSTYGFAAGTHSNTTYDTINSYLELDGADSGTFTSRIIDVNGSVTWDSVTGTLATVFPYYKNLPDSRAVETGYDDGNIDMSDNVLLYHFEESTYDSTDYEVVDSSGQGNDGTSYLAEPTAAYAGKIGRGARFNSADLDYIFLDDPGTNSNATFDNTVNVRSYSMWFNADGNTFRQVLFEEGGGTKGLNIFIEGGSVYAGAWNRSQGWNGTWISGAVTAGVWNHIVYVFDFTGDAEMEAFLNGQSLGTAAIPFAVEAHTGNDGLGAMVDGSMFPSGSGNGNNYYFDGIMDEVGVWDRVLTSDEVQDMYMRGAYEVKYQIRTCDDAACDTEQFVGADGTTGTFLSEFDNNSAGTTPPTQFAAAGLTDNQYAQYIVYLDRLAGETGSPQINSIEVGRAHYASGTVEISNSDAPTFSEINSFTLLSFTPGDTYELAATMQISVDNTVWYYWDGAAWSVASSSADSSTPTDIASNLTTFTATAGTGRFYWRFYIPADGASQVEVDQIDFNFYFK